MWFFYEFAQSVKTLACMQAFLHKNTFLNTYTIQPYKQRVPIRVLTRTNSVHDFFAGLATHRQMVCTNNHLHKHNRTYNSSKDKHQKSVRWAHTHTHTGIHYCRLNATTHNHTHTRSRIHTRTWKAYSWPYSLLSWDFMTLLVRAGSFMASHDARAKKSSHCFDRLRPKLACKMG